MTIQNSIYLPNRMSKKRYFYDPLLEKGILNTVYSLDRDSSMDNEDYKDVCFCPSNNKLYAVRTNSSDSTSHVDVICPNSTTKTCSTSCAGGPEAIITIESGGGAIVYCPSVDRIFTISSQADVQKLSKINPRDNTVEVVNVGTSPVTSSVTSLVYNPMTDLMYASFDSAAVTLYRMTGIVEASWPIQSWGDYSEVTRICVDPERNYLHLFDGGTIVGSGPFWETQNFVNAKVDKNNYVTYTHVTDASNNWLEPEYTIKDVIYCPYDSAIYWLASIGSGSAARNSDGAEGCCFEAWASGSPYFIREEDADPDAGDYNTGYYSCDAMHEVLVSDTMEGCNAICCGSLGASASTPPSNEDVGSYVMRSGIMDVITGAMANPPNRVIEMKSDSNLSNIGEHDRLVYCPDNNMIYVLGENNIHMINPTDTYGTTPVAEFYDSGVGIKTNGVCYSHINNRIYGVGNDGYIQYIDPTT